MISKAAKKRKSKIIYRLSINLYNLKIGFGRCPKRGEGGSPTLSPFPGKGVFGKDAEIRTHQALHEAKPSECPKGDRDSELEICSKKDFFYNLSRSFHCGSNYCYIFSAILSPISEQDSFVIPSLMMSPVRKPSFNTLLTAFSTASASFTISKL